MVAMTDRAATAGPHTNVTVMLHVNGHAHRLPLDPRVTLLDALRDYLHLTGTKKGYDRGACGACTVLLDGRRVLSCLTPAVQCDDRAVTTMEGLAPEGAPPSAAGDSSGMTPFNAGAASRARPCRRQHSFGKDGPVPMDL